MRAVAFLTAENILLWMTFHPKTFPSQSFPLKNYEHRFAGVLCPPLRLTSTFGINFNAVSRSALGGRLPLIQSLTCRNPSHKREMKSFHPSFRYFPHFWGDEREFKRMKFQGCYAPLTTELHYHINCIMFASLLTCVITLLSTCVWYALHESSLNSHNYDHVLLVRK